MADKGFKFDSNAKFDFGAGNPQVQLPAAPALQLPAPVARRVRALKTLHKSYVDLEKQFQEELRALERKYDQLKEPLFVKRASFVNGDSEPTDEEVGPADVAGAEIQIAPGGQDIRGVPEFWLTALKNCDPIAELITERDEEALRALRDVRVENLSGERQGFAIHFHFAENPCFTNQHLVKNYFLVEDEEYGGELTFESAEGTNIEWKAGKNLTVKTVTKKQKHGGKGRGGKGGQRTKTVEEPCESFFNFFNPPKWDGNDAEDEETAEAMMEQDFDLGCLIKDKIVPQAVLWFTGEASEFEFDEEGEFDDEDDEGDEDEDEEEEEEEEEKPKKKGGKGGWQEKPAAGGAGGQPQNPPDCKQQ